MRIVYSSSILLLVATGVSCFGSGDIDQQQQQQQHTLSRPSLADKLSHVSKREAKHDSHSSMMHSHLSRKVFDRACAASKDTIDEIIACLTSNQLLVSTVSKDVAAMCYKDSFGTEFKPEEFMKHKEMICNNRDKFENMTACVYRKTAEGMDSKQIEKMTEAMVDVGLCIINALDG